MVNNLTIREIDEEETDVWFVRMYNAGEELRSNLQAAFHEEKASIQFKALPPKKRRYFMIYADGAPELLAGINALCCDISSFSKVVCKTKSKAKGRDCVKKLIEEAIVPECRRLGKAFFSAMTNNQGKKVFEYLRYQLPCGIKEIKDNGTKAGYHSFTAIVRQH